MFFCTLHKFSSSSLFCWACCHMMQHIEEESETKICKYLFIAPEKHLLFVALACINLLTMKKRHLWLHFLCLQKCLVIIDIQFNKTRCPAIRQVPLWTRNFKGIWQCWLQCNRYCLQRWIEFLCISSIQSSPKLHELSNEMICCMMKYLASKICKQRNFARIISAIPCVRPQDILSYTINYNQSSVHDYTIHAHIMSMSRLAPGQTKTLHFTLSASFGEPNMKSLWYVY